MAIMDRHALAHLGVRGEGTTRPLCKDWRSSWNWTLVPAEVTCPACRAALTANAAGAGADEPTSGR
ncbi:MAG: hypothetical protein HZB56_22935 [Deltaproteobacteria bacterium]|nr:hypothetical protein [Deltaproteobacteria bacterium]